MSVKPPPLPYERVTRGTVVGYTGRFGPGRTSCLVGCLTVLLQSADVAFWLLSSNATKSSGLLVGVLPGLAPLLLGFVAFLALLPLNTFGLVRGTTALRLRIERPWAWTGIASNGLSVAGWLYLMSNAVLA
jgi:hypothetical protein